jgi:hypothetical protein
MPSNDRRQEFAERTTRLMKKKSDTARTGKSKLRDPAIEEGSPD